MKKNEKQHIVVSKQTSYAEPVLLRCLITRVEQVPAEPSENGCKNANGQPGNNSVTEKPPLSFIANGCPIKKISTKLDEINLADQSEGLSFVPF